MFGFLRKVSNVVSAEAPSLCEDCVSYRHSANPCYARCANPLAKDSDGVLHLVIKNAVLPPDSYGFCDISRRYDRLCGKDGRYFERKQKPVPKPVDPYRGVLDNIDCTLLRMAQVMEDRLPKKKR